MKKILFILIYTSILQKSQLQTIYSQYPVYVGKDLGLTYTKTTSLFRIWSPTAREAQLLLYKEGVGGYPFETVSLLKGESGTWYTQLAGNRENTFYTFRVKINQQWSDEVTDPYAKAVGINGRRAIVTDMNNTNPAGWANDKSPDFSNKNLPRL